MAAAIGAGPEEAATADKHTAAAAAQPSQPDASASLDQERHQAFALLQPICSMLLLQRAEPQQMAELLTGAWAAAFGVNGGGGMCILGFLLLVDGRLCDGRRSVAS